jgi:hypothetical protein
MAKGIAGDLTRWFKKLDKLLGTGSGGASGPPTMRYIGEQAILLIVKRTRQGWSVRETGAKREPLAKLSDNYKKYRESNRRDLKKELNITGSGNVRARADSKSRLTFTGQMLDGMRVIKAIAKTVLIGSTGSRTDGKDNSDIARWVSSGKYPGGVPRPFNFLSDKELLQIKRIWRKAFGDLKNRFR